MRTPNIGLQRAPRRWRAAAELRSFGERPTRRTLWVCVMVALAGIVAADPMEAQTPWEIYVQNPTPKNADAVATLSYSTGRFDEDDVDVDLDVLEAEVSAQDRSAVRLAFRLHAPGHYEETICVMLGRLIRANPRLFLEELKAAGIQDIVGNLGFGFVDRDQAQRFEVDARINALKRVTDPSLKATRDRCIGMLKTR